jgi:phosphoglucosamine mutase
MINVPIAKGFKLDASIAVKDSVAAAESALNGTGRVVLRASGTEPLIRVMVEGRDADQVRHAAEAIANAVRLAASGG